MGKKGKKFIHFQPRVLISTKFRENKGFWHSDLVHLCMRKDAQLRYFLELCETACIFNAPVIVPKVIRLLFLVHPFILSHSCLFCIVYGYSG